MPVHTIYYLLLALFLPNFYTLCPNKVSNYTFVALVILLGVISEFPNVYRFFQFAQSLHTNSILGVRFELNEFNFSSLKKTTRDDLNITSMCMSCTDF